MIVIIEGLICIAVAYLVVFLILKAIEILQGNN
jgi:hypothetical protein